MYRFSLLLCLLFIFLSSFTAGQNKVQIAETTCHAFQVVAGRNYFITASPESDEDIAFGVGFEPDLPMTVVNGRRSGFSETNRVEAVSTELEVCVYVNKKDAGHTVVVIDENQKFPFFKWREKGTVNLETDPAGFITSFGFNWKRKEPVVSMASSEIRDRQTIAGESAISYSFSVTRDIPLDILLVPDSNHLDLALHTDSGKVFETTDNNRSAENMNDTESGQIEWMQISPSTTRIEFVVENKTSFAGSFRMAVRRIDSGKYSLKATSWHYLNSTDLKTYIDSKRSGFPLINDAQAVTYEIEPQSAANSYSFAAAAFEPGLKFALIVSIDSNKPPLFFQAGGENNGSVIFQWSVLAGEVSLYGITSGKHERFESFPFRGKIRISIVAFDGSGRVSVTLRDAETLRELNTPDPLVVDRNRIIGFLSDKYDGFDFIGSNIRLYRYHATPGVSYKLKVTPQFPFDAAILDPSYRTEENPGALSIIDENGSGSAEELKLEATTDFVEFAVAGIRYFHGIVKGSNRRLGGTGYFKIEIENVAEKAPELIEVIDVDLPNEFISREIDLEYEPWDKDSIKEASELPAFPSFFDRRIIEALAFSVGTDPDPIINNGTH